MELWFAIALLLMALIATVLALVRQIRLWRALRQLLTRLLKVWHSRGRATSLLLLLLTGCDAQQRQLHTWQQEQVAEVQLQAQHNAETTRSLVGAQAENQREFLRLQQDLARQREALEADRQAVALARQRLPLVAAAFEGAAATVLGILALGVAGYLLLNAGRAEPSAEIEEVLLLEIAGESNLLRKQLPALSVPSGSPAISPPEAQPYADPPLTSLLGDDTCPTS